MFLPDVCDNSRDVDDPARKDALDRVTPAQPVS